MPALPIDTIANILKYIRDDPPKSFEEYCNEARTVFGNPKSEFRSRVYQKRQDLLRTYLKSGQSTDRWHQLLQNYGLSITSNADYSNMQSSSRTSAASKPSAAAFENDAMYSSIENQPAPFKTMSAQVTTTTPSSLGDQILQHVRALKSDIDFYKIESNGYGIYVLYGKQVDIKGGKKQAEVITILRAVSFFPDVLEVEAELWPDGGGLYLKDPSMPSPLWKFPLKVLDGMATALNTSICKSTLQTYKTEATRIATDDEAKFNIISVAFPKGITCNNSHFNDDADGNKLVKRIITFTATHPAFTKDGALLEFPFSLAFWRFIVDGSERLAEVPVAPDYSSQVAKMIDGVGSLYLSGNKMDVEPARLEMQEMRRLLEQYRQDADKARFEVEESKKVAMKQAQATTSQQATDFMRLQEQLAAAESKAKAAAEEAARVKQEQQQQFTGYQQHFQSIQQQLAEKEKAILQQTQRLQQQSQELNQKQTQYEAAAQWQQANAQVENDRIRSEAQKLIKEANRREQVNGAAASAVADSDGNVSICSLDAVAYHPQTGEGLTEEQVGELIQEFANFKKQSYEQVTNWIKSMNAQSEQDAVDLLFA